MATDIPKWAPGRATTGNSSSSRLRDLSFGYAYCHRHNVCTMRTAEHTVHKFPFSMMIDVRRRRTSPPFIICKKHFFVARNGQKNGQLCLESDKMRFSLQTVASLSSQSDRLEAVPRIRLNLWNLVNSI